MGAVAAIFGFGDGSKYSVIINAMSALFSAFTHIILFWTITHFVRRLLNKDFEDVTVSDEIAILFAGVIRCFSFYFQILLVFCSRRRGLFYVFYVYCTFGLAHYQMGKRIS